MPGVTYPPAAGKRRQKTDAGTRVKREYLEMVADTVKVTINN